MNEQINNKMIIPRQYWLTILVGILCTTVFAEQFRFKYFSTSEGLPSNSIRSITQDYRGFVWIGTESGISRFDGRNFKTFKNIFRDSTSIGSNYINYAFEDRNRQLWVGTDCGVYIYDPETESFSYFAEQTDQKKQISSSTTHILEDSKGNIWFATEGQGVFAYDTTNKKLSQFESTPNEQEVNLSSNFVISLYIDTKDNVWVSVKSSTFPLYKYDNENHIFRSFPIKNLPPKFLVYAITADPDGNLWLGTWEHGLCKLTLKNGTITGFASPHEKGGVSHIHSISWYDRDFLLAGSDDGVLQFNVKTESYTQITASELQSDGLSDKFIYPIYQDREGGLWIGGYYKGLNYAAPNKGDIEGYTHSEYKNSVGGNIISCFCEDPSGNIWIGSDDGGLSYFDTQKKHFTNYMPDPRKNSLSYHNVHALMLDDNKLWIGTYAGGLNVLDLNIGKFKVYFSDAGNPHTIDNNSIYALYKDYNGEIWIGTMAGLNKYDKKTDRFIRVRSIGSTTLDIVQEEDSTLWFATWESGLYRFNPVTEEWKHYSVDKKVTNTIPNNMVLSLSIDKNGRLWVGTDSGLCYFDKANDCFVNETLNTPSSSISNIICYKDSLWLSTSNGFVCFSPTSKETKVFTTSDGLQNDQFTINGSMLCSNNKMYLGTTHGFNIMSPQTFSSNEYVPPVWITNFQIFNKDLPIGKDHLLNKAIGYTDQIVLNHKQNILSIEYAALSYSAPGKNKYKYLLEGFDTDWNYVGNQNKATYTNLPAGKYVFRVMGSNNDGIWNEKEATLAIRVLPPFWRSTLAYIIYTVLITSFLFYLIYIFRKRTERKNKIRMRKLHAEKEKELYNAKINFFTQVAHEIRTPVSLIIGPLEKIIEQSTEFKPTIQEDLHIINKNSQRLLALVNQLLDFRKAEQGGFTPCFSNQNVYTLINNIYDRFLPLMNKKNIVFELKTENKDLEANIDVEAFTKVVSNLLTNAYKYAKERITMEITNNENQFSLNITDDGKGIQENELKNIFKPFYQVAGNNKPGTGIGLSLVKLLVEAHHGMIDVSSIPGKTSFTVTLPLKQVKVSTEIPQQTLQAELNDYSHLMEDETDDASDQPKTDNPTLLIVEDNIDLCNFLYRKFKNDYNIVTSHNGKEGLEVMSKQPVDMIISDIMMPVMDGIEFCKEIKTNFLYSHIPVILLTAKTEGAAKVESIKIGADAYIEKPFSFQLLQVQIENLLNSRKLLKKKFSEMPFMKLDSIAGNKADEVFLSKLNGIIEKNISNVDFSIDVLAEQLCISRSGLFSKIKTLTDMTPNELIHLVRLKKAAELLSSKEYRINEICYLVGFNNPSYFSKCFQKQFGVLPKDFTNKQA